MVARGAVPNAILLIEDDADVRESVLAILEALGKNVVWARNGQEGLEKLSTLEAPCLILVDLLMPVLDGREFVRRLRAQAPGAKHRVVLMSANHNALELTRQLPVDGLLIKPFSLEQLEDVVRQQCP